MKLASNFLHKNTRVTTVYLLPLNETTETCLMGQYYYSKTLLSLLVQFILAFFSSFFTHSTRLMVSHCSTLWLIVAYFSSLRLVVAHCGLFWVVLANHVLLGPLMAHGCSLWLIVSRYVLLCIIIAYCLFQYIPEGSAPKTFQILHQCK